MVLLEIMEEVFIITHYSGNYVTNGGGEPSGELASAIDSAFGSFEAFKEKFSNAAGTRFGSGWAWLMCSKRR